MKIAYKIGILFLIPLVIATVLQIYAYSSFTSDVSDIRSNVIIPSSQNLETSANIRFLSTSAAKEVNSAFIYWTDSDITRFESSVDSYGSIIETRARDMSEMESFISSKQESNPGLARSFSHLKDLIVTSETMSLEILDVMTNAEPTEENIEIVISMINSLMSINDDILSLTTSVLGFSAKEFSESGKLLVANQEQGVVFLYATLLVMTLLFIASLVSIHFLVVRPIQNMTSKIDKISQGDLTVQMPKNTSKDEIGDLIAAFERTLTSLKLAMKLSSPELKKEKESLEKILEEKELIKKQLEERTKRLEELKNELSVKNAQLEMAVKELKEFG